MVYEDKILNPFVSQEEEGAETPEEEAPEKETPTEEGETSE